MAAHQEWELGGLASYLRHDQKTWSQAVRTRYNKRRSIRQELLRMAELRMELDHADVAAWLDDIRGQKTLTNHLVALRRGNPEVSRRVVPTRRRLTRPQQAYARQQAEQHTPPEARQPRQQQPPPPPRQRRPPPAAQQHTHPESRGRPDIPGESQGRRLQAAIAQQVADEQAQLREAELRRGLRRQSDVVEEAVLDRFRT